MIFDAEDNQLKTGDTLLVVKNRKFVVAYVTTMRYDRPWYKLGMVYTDGQKEVKESTVGKFDDVLKSDARP